MFIQVIIIKFFNYFDDLKHSSVLKKNNIGNLYGQTFFHSIVFCFVVVVHLWNKIQSHLTGENDILMSFL